jgi:hypothetical protein
MRIRSVVITCGLAVIVASQGAAQYRPVVMGLGIGASLSDFQNPDTDSRWGFSGGLFVGKATYRTLSMLEVNYVQKGGGDTHIDYIELPLTFGGVGRTRNGVGRARLYGGISAAFKVSCSEAGVCDAAESVEWGAPFGLMIGRHTANDQFVAVDVRYNIPLSNAFDGFNTYNQTWQFRLLVGRAR